MELDGRILFLILFVFYCVSALIGEGEALLVGAVPHPWRPTKLFLFGDSYAATGNNVASLGVDSDRCWISPYGDTFPGKPTGRFSDGRVLTGFIAKYIAVKSPLAYKFRSVAGNYLKYGMNFAYGGGSSRNEDLYRYPGRTTQINYFHRLIKSSVYNTTDLFSSVALVTVSGDDNNDFFFNEGFVKDLKRIYAFGVKKILVTNLAPMGCLPRITCVSSFKNCNETLNSLVKSQNLLLQQAVAKLNTETESSSFIVLDLYASFMSVFKNKGDHLGSIKFKKPLKPCCVGQSDPQCGRRSDMDGSPMYTVCEHDSAFFWDDAHPSQQGWNAVYSNLQATLHQLY